MQVKLVDLLVKQKLNQLELRQVIATSLFFDLATPHLQTQKQSYHYRFRTQNLIPQRLPFLSAKPIFLGPQHMWLVHLYQVESFLVFQFLPKPLSSQIQSSYDHALAVQHADNQQD